MAVTRMPRHTWDRLRVSLDGADLLGLRDPHAPSAHQKPRTALPGLQGGSGHLTLCGFMGPAQVESPPFIGLMMIISKQTTNLLSILVYKTSFSHFFFAFSQFKKWPINT